MGDKGGGNNVRVVCRFRPKNQKEIDLGGNEVYTIDDPDQTTVTIRTTEAGKHTFAFDRIFPGSCTQRQVYDYAARPVIEDIMKGYNGTIFVYGQTSSGKTHTMQGPDISDQELKGIIPRMNGTIFETVQNANQNIEFLVKASYIEIYMEKIRDLLDGTKSNLQVREEKSKGIWIEGATEVYVSSERDVLDVIRVGAANRAIAETKMNMESSRSHSIFILSVNQKNLADLSNKTGKLYLVDLAGSEKVEKTGAQGTTLDEAKMINKSLSALGNVINALTDGKSSHVPYRDSKLTRVLQESLGGNSRTTLVINCSPSPFNEAETLSTLRFGNRAKSIKNTAKVNAEKSVAELKLLLANSDKEINKLRTTIVSLEDKVAELEGNPRPKRIHNDEGEEEPVGATTISSVEVIRYQERISLLEETARRLEEEKQTMQEMHESVTEELKEKEHELELIDLLKEEITSLRTNEQTLAKENELLIVKLADMTIANEKALYDNNEGQLEVETLAAQNTALKEEIENIKKKMDSLATERNKTSKLNSALSFKKDLQEEWSKAKDETVKKNIQEELHRIEEIEIALIEGKEDALLPDMDENKILAGLRSENDSHKRENEQLRRDKEQLTHLVEQIRADYEERLAQQQVDTSSTPVEKSEETHRLEKELQSVREQNNQRAAEFDALKAALLKDLENRCQKVIELEILLDEAREQYQNLLLQVKNSNSKTLQHKVNFLQKNLEQLTTVQQQLVNENNRLKLENQVYVKQLAIRNERIHGLELLLQDAQEKLQKHAANPAETDTKPMINAPTPKTPAAKGSAMRGGKKVLPANLQSGVVGGRIAKPIRGGGAAPAVSAEDEDPVSTIPSPASPEMKKGSSLWDMFRPKAPKSPSEAPTSPVAASGATVYKATSPMPEPR